MVDLWRLLFHRQCLKNVGLISVCLVDWWWVAHQEVLTQIKILTEFINRNIKMKNFMMTIKVPNIQQVTYLPRWCPIAFAQVSLITSPGTAITHREVVIKILRKSIRIMTKTIMKTTTKIINNCFWTLKMTEFIIHIQLRIRSCSSKMLCHQFNKKLMHPNQHHHFHQCRQFLCTNRFPRLLWTSPSGSYNRIWLLIWRSWQIRPK